MIIDALIEAELGMKEESNDWSDEASRTAAIAKENTACWLSCSKRNPHKKTALVGAVVVLVLGVAQRAQHFGSSVSSERRCR